ncbi:MAG TPA: amino acid permease, partial [Thermopetrobacter sp.]|nr:amino acid permease [Thermopetrobacter sp.]
MQQTTAESKAGLIRGLGLLDATTIVVGSMIGSGIFVVPADIARQTNSPGLILTVWAVTALLTLMAALTYGELAAAMPRAGGQYVYLREAYSPLFGFLYGWTLFLVIQTGTIAAVAVAFAKFTGIFVPWFSESRYLFRAGPIGITTQQLLAIGVLVFLTWVNTRGLRTGARVQNVFTIAKVGALLGLIALGFVFRHPEAVERNFNHMWDGVEWGWFAVKAVAVAMVGSLFSSDAWNN